MFSDCRFCADFFEYLQVVLVALVMGSDVAG